MKSLFLVASTVFALAFFSGCGDEATTIVEDTGSFKEQKVQSNKNYHLKTTDGKDIKFTIENDTLTSKELNGKYVLINFWATWCAPCIQEMPTLVKLQKENANKLQIVGVLIEKNKDPKELAEFMEKFGMNFPVTVGEENYRMAKAFDDVKMFPESFVYAPNGKFLEKFIGEIEEDQLKKLIKN